MSVNETRKRDYKKRSKQSRKKYITIKKAVGGICKLNKAFTNNDSIIKIENDRNEKLKKYIEDKSNQKSFEELTKSYNEYFKKIVENIINIKVDQILKSISSQDQRDKIQKLIDEENDKSFKFVSEYIEKKNYFGIAYILLYLINLNVYEIQGDTIKNNLITISSNKGHNIDIQPKQENSYYNKIFDCANLYFYMYLMTPSNETKIDNEIKTIICIYYLSTFLLKKENPNVFNIININHLLEENSKDKIDELKYIKDNIKNSKDKPYFYDLLLDKVNTYLDVNITSYIAFINSELDKNPSNFKIILKNKYDILLIKYERLKEELIKKGINIDTDVEVKNVEEQISKIKEELGQNFIPLPRLLS